MIKSGLLSGMNTMLARAGKVQYMSDKAKAEIERALKAKKLSKIDLKAIKDGEYDNELSSEARDALIRQIKRSQIFKGNVDFIPELIEKIPDVEKVNTTVSAKGGVTINSITLKNGKVIKPSKIRSAQTSLNSLEV